MQVMWTASPLGKIHCVSLPRRRVAISLVSAAALLVGVGVAVSLAAFKLAVEFRPELATAIGGVMTASELEKRDSHYRETLRELHGEVARARQELGHLQALKDEFARLATPRGQRAAAKLSTEQPAPGVGGPAVDIVPGKADSAAWHAEDLSANVDSARGQLEALVVSLEQARTNWDKDLQRIERLPTAPPLPCTPMSASRFGVRLDPFTHTPARHEGVDLGAAAGTPILATAAGVVARVASDRDYGNVVDIDHGNGYLTRYAHAQTISVKRGQRVSRGTPIGTVGSTGRSTAPHLHYEIRLNNQPQNPLQYQISLK